MRYFLAFAGLVILWAMPVSSSAQQSDSTQAGVAVTKLAEHVYKLECNNQFSVNVVASIGPDGILLIDAGRPQTAEPLRKALDSLGGGSVKYVVSTHVHGDHTGGNQALDLSVTIMAHDFTARGLSGGYFALPSRPGTRGVDIAVNSDFSIFFNGEEIKLIHVPSAHTGGDLMAYFTQSNVLYVADLLFADMIPFVDLNLGGNVRNYADNVRRLADTLSSEVIVVPGHGRNLTVNDIREISRMLEYTCAKVGDAITDGKTPEEVLQDTALAQWASWSNTFETTRMEYLIPCIFRSFQSGTEALPPSICGPLTATIVSDGVQAAIAQYQTLKQNQSAQYNFHENELNMLGYQLMWRQMLPDAIAIFELNVREHPESANVYDSMGEAYMNSSQRELAIQSYEKSLELNPENTNAVEMLRQLRSGQ